jgi:hypothetical protein
LFYVVKDFFHSNTPIIVLILNERRCVINVNNVLRLMKYKVIRNYYHTDSTSLNRLTICAISKRDKKEFAWARTQSYYIIGKYI